MAESRLVLEPGAVGGGVAGRLPGGVKAGRARRPFNFMRSGPYFAGLLLLAFVAYWPTYFSRVLSADHYTHFHAWLFRQHQRAPPASSRSRKVSLSRARLFLLQRSVLTIIPVS